jgi:hypothetical protein
MKTIALSLFLCVVSLCTPAVLGPRLQTQSFLIDSSKDYVYLKFDHVGPRKPLAQDTTSQGLWLRLVDNCRVPIIVATFDPGTGDPGVGVFDEVIAAPVGHVVFHFKGEARPKRATKTKPKPPDGYSSPDTFSTTTIAPGEDLLFSVPLNHVGPSWGMEVRFYLDAGGGRYFSGPESIVSFDWDDIPEGLRGGAATKPNAQPVIDPKTEDLHFSIPAGGPAFEVRVAHPFREAQGCGCWLSLLQ